MKRTWLVLACLTTPTPAAAQICGTFAEAADHLVRHREVFDGAKWADARASLGIETIAPNDPVELVMDTAACTSLIDKEVEIHGLPFLPGPTSYAIYRYGDYYAIEYRPPPRQVGDTIYHANAFLSVYTVGQGQKLKGAIPLDWQSELDIKRPTPSTGSFRAGVGAPQPPEAAGASTGPATKRSILQDPSAPRSQRRK